jgi:hypothetical protein
LPDGQRDRIARVFRVRRREESEGMAYRPRIQKQGDGSQCQWQNCSPTSHSMAVDRDWLGARRGAPKAIRDKIALTCPGTSLSQNGTAISALYGTRTDPRYEIPWGSFLDGIVSGRGAVVSIRYIALHGTPFDSCRTFDGRHAIFVNERRFNATLGRYEALVFDPLADHRFSWIPQGPQWWPMALLQKAMLAIYNPNPDRVVDCAFTRNTNATTKKALFSGGKLRTGAGVGFAAKDDLDIGAMCVVADQVEGGQWTVNGKIGKVWYKIPTINGKTASALYGVPNVFAAKGWFTGPTGAT